VDGAAIRELACEAAIPGSFWPHGRSVWFPNLGGGPKIERGPAVLSDLRFACVQRQSPGREGVSFREKKSLPAFARPNLEFRGSSVAIDAGVEPGRPAPKASKRQVLGYRKKIRSPFGVIRDDFEPGIRRG
jgi:hypothetical protein